MRIPFDSLCLRAAAQEIERTLAGAQVQHVAQPAPTDVVLTLRARGATHRLLLSCDARHARVHLTVIRHPNPPAPPAFCMACRRHLEGSRLAAAAQRGFDRVLDLHFRSAAGLEHTLVAELMGRHSNLILLAETGAVIDACKRISHRLSRHREVLPGRPYAPPPGQEDRLRPFDPGAVEAAQSAVAAGDPEAAAARLMVAFEGMSPFLAQEIVLRALHAPLREVWEEVFGAAARGEWSPVLVRGCDVQPIGAYPLPTVQYPADVQHARSTLSLALDHLHSALAAREEREALARGLEAGIRRALEGRRRRMEALRQAIAESKRAEEHRRLGELLLANLHRVEPKAGLVEVEDAFGDGSRIVIPLDPRLSGTENAEQLFRRYRKARGSAEVSAALLDRVEREARALERALDDIPTRDASGLKALQADLAREQLLRPQDAPASAEKERRPDFEGRRIRTVTTPDGWEILVGENAEANDYLTTRVAAPNDYWLHVRAGASAHVVIRTGRRGQVPPSVLRIAAGLAARHSPSRHSSLVPVDYTLRKHVRRPRGAAPGTVLYRNEKTLYVEPGE